MQTTALASDGLEAVTSIVRTDCSTVGDVIVVQGQQMTEEDHEELKSLAKKARDANQRGVALLLEIKDILVKAHAIYHRVGRSGEYSSWVESNFPDLSQRTAERYRKVHDVFGDQQPEMLLKFEVSALYILCEEKTPPQARRWALDAAAKGEAVTAQKVRFLIAAALLKERAASTDAQKSLKTAAKTSSECHKLKKFETEHGVIIIRPKSGVMNVVEALKEAMQKTRVN